MFGGDEMENIMKVLGDNAKFYPNYLANHVASDFRFHLNNGIGKLEEELQSKTDLLALVVVEKSGLVEENAELREMLSDYVHLVENDSSEDFLYRFNEIKELLNK